MKATFTQLMAFRAVADAGSVGAGADALMVSQPAVSKQLRDLQSALGTKLFERHAKGMRLTEAGELLANYVRRMFALAEEAEEALDDLQSLRRGSLAVGATTTIGTYLMPRILVRFRRRFPAISLKLEIDSSETLQRRLEEGGLDLGLSEVPPTRSMLVGKIVAHDRLIAVAWPKHALARKKGIAMKRLAAEPFVVRDTGSATQSFVEQALTEHGLTVNATLSLASTEAIKHAVSAGFGIAIISEIAAGPEIASKRLVRLNVPGLNLRRPIYHIRHQARRESKAATAFLCLLRDAVRGFA